MITGSERLLQIVLDTASLKWADNALCAEIGGDLWFPEKGEPTREAKAVCRSCPVQAECLEYAMENGERFGIWGALSEHERRPLSRGTEGRAA
jgi:WhiB family redox-sensing transcriptional regulator